MMPMAFSLTVPYNVRHIIVKYRIAVNYVEHWAIGAPDLKKIK
jgi:hypothetical protein